MKRTLVVILAGVCVGALANSAAAAPASRKKPKMKSVSDESLMHGPDIWAQVEEKLERDRYGDVEYRENVVLDPQKPKNPQDPRHLPNAPTTQTREAPEWRDGGPEAVTRPLVMEDMVDGFLDRFEEALPILADEERELTAEDLADLKEISGGLLAHSRELVKIYGRLSRERRVRGEGWLKIDPELQRGQVEESILAATDEWLEVVERVETSAIRLRRGALMRSPVLLRKAWKGLVASGLELPQFRSSIQALEVELERGKSQK
jgi:hypothetical protein